MLRTFPTIDKLTAYDYNHVFNKPPTNKLDSQLNFAALSVLRNFISDVFERGEEFVSTVVHVVFVLALPGQIILSYTYTIKQY